MVTKDINSIPLDAPLSVKKPNKYLMFFRHLQGMKHTSVQPKPVDLRGKWVFISGANSGIGRRAALQFASWGANVALACRQPPPHEPHPRVVVEECQKAAADAGHQDSKMEWWETDYGVLSTVEDVCRRWLESGRQIDILCNNAGLANIPAGGSKLIMTPDGFEVMHQVNLLAHVLLTMRLLPAIIKAPEPRIINTISSGHYNGHFDLTNFHGEHFQRDLDERGIKMGMQNYYNNKLMFMLWTAELQRRLLQHNETRHITVNGVHPGYVNSGIGAERLLKLSPIMVKISKLITPILTVDDYQGSQCIIFAATLPETGADPALQGVGKTNGKGGGRYFNRVWEKEPMPYVRDPDARLRVWKKLNLALELEQKGLLTLLGLDYRETESLHKEKV